MDIRELGPDDFAAAAALWEACGLTRPWNDPYDDLARAVAGPSSAVLGGWDGDTLAATAMVGHDGHRGWVYYLAVAPALQGRGLGREVMAAAEAWLVARGLPKVQLMVRDTNEAALGFYAALGYQREAVQVLSRWFGDKGPSPSP